MPLVQLISTKKEGVIALWRMDEPLGEMEAAHIWSKEEKDELDMIRLDQRRGEWLALRLSVRAILQLQGLEYQPIQKTAANKPFVAGTNYELSFAHCPDYVAVYWHPHQPVGVDIERLDRQVARLANKFLTEEEKNLFPLPEQMLEAWCYKETLYKVYSHKQLDFKSHLRLTMDQEGIMGIISKEGIKSQHRLACLRYEDCILTYNINE
jgi:4'-phosphopantetheinyl transferase EntD